MQIWSKRSQSHSPEQVLLRRTIPCRVHSGPLCKGFRTSDPQRNVMGQSTEMSLLIYLYAFSDIPKSLEIFNGNFIILVCLPF